MTEITLKVMLNLDHTQPQYLPTKERIPGQCTYKQIQLSVNNLFINQLFCGFILQMSYILHIFLTHKSSVVKKPPALLLMG